MNSDISAVGAAQALALQPQQNGDPAKEAEFASWLKGEMVEVNRQIHGADKALDQLASGQVDNLHQVMLQLEKAKTSFELVVEVRNKLMEGYQKLMQMQI